MNFIVDPITNTKYAIHSTKGLHLLKQYIKLYQYGGAEDATSEPEPQANPESEPQANPEPEPQANPEPEPQANPEPEPQQPIIERLEQLIEHMYDSYPITQRNICDITATTYYSLLNEDPRFDEVSVNSDLDPDQNYKMHINVMFRGGLDNDDYHNCVVVLYNEHAYIIGSWVELFRMTIITRPRGEFMGFINRVRRNETFNFEEFEGFFIPANIRGRYRILLEEGGYEGDNHNNYEAFTSERDDIGQELYYRFAELVKLINHSEDVLNIQLRDRR